MSLENVITRKKSEKYAFAVPFVDDNKGSVGRSLGVPRAFLIRAKLWEINFRKSGWNVAISLESLKTCKKTEKFAFALQFANNNKGIVGLSLGVPSVFEFGLNCEKVF